MKSTIRIDCRSCSHLKICKWVPEATVMAQAHSLDTALESSPLKVILECEYYQENESKPDTTEDWRLY